MADNYNNAGFSAPDHQSRAYTNFGFSSPTSTSEGNVAYNQPQNLRCDESSPSSHSEASPDQANQAIAGPPLLEKLKSRGRGTYTCPHGVDCQRGGVQPDGELVVFARNSAFR